MSSSAKRLRSWPSDSVGTAWTPGTIELKPLRAPGAPDATDPVADAYALGFQQGREEGERAERARLGPAIRAAEEALQTINERDERWTGAIEDNLVTIALGIARHLVDRELDVDPAFVDGLVAKALETFPVDQPVQIRVHPDDLTIIKTLRADRPAGSFARAEELSAWVPDPMVARGGCVVEGRDRIVDGRVETALERIYRRIVYRHA